MYDAPLSPPPPALPLLIEPHVLEAPIVVNAVGVQDEAFHVRMPAGGGARIRDDGARQILGEPALDLPHQLFALGGVGFLRLLVDQGVDVLVAVLREVAL